VAELLQELTDISDPHPDLYHEADRTLLALDGAGEVAATVLRFEVAALRLLGYLPALDACVVCGKPVAATGRVLFGQLAGGVLCPDCRAGQRQIVSLSPGVLALLREWAGSRAGAELSTVDRRLVGELRGLLNHYLANLLGHQPRMHKYLGL
jgi:DNA repair protein RecO (recombination protein O)